MIEILDTTLRDGMQGYGITYSVEDKLQIIKALRELGLPLIEIGNPSSGDIDSTLLGKVSGDDLVAFGSTKRKDIFADQDPDLSRLAHCNLTKIAIFGKSSRSQACNVLGINGNQNLELISISISFLVRHGKHVLFDAEHYFEGYHEDPDYALSVIQTAFNAGCDTVILCDTLGATMLGDFHDILTATLAAFPDKKFGVHCHNDCGLAVAQSMIAMGVGISHIQGTLLGIGERCGNTCLSTLIPNILLKSGGVHDMNIDITRLYDVCRTVSELSNITVPPSLPYVGDNAFNHKAGMHCNAISKASESFEHIQPEAVGNHHNLCLSILSGRSNVRAKLKEFFPDVDLGGNVIEQLLLQLKTGESQGYHYEIAEASFYLLCRKVMGLRCNYFNLIRYTTVTEESEENTAVIHLDLDGTLCVGKSVGVGPVNALDNALRQALSPHFTMLNGVQLIDYKVRVLDSVSATSAKVRVLITSTDGKATWTTVGVSTDIIKASYNALCDSINYYLSTNDMS